MKRRELLRKTGVGLAATTTAMGVAGARTGSEPVAVEQAPDVAAAVIDRNDHLLADLAADDVAHRSDLAPAAGDVRTTTAAVDGEQTPFIEVERTVAAGELTVRVLPEFDFAWAVLDDGSGVQAYGDGVSPEDDCTGCYYETCYCVDECDPYGCCEYDCTCVLKCECGGPCPA